MRAIHILAAACIAVLLFVACGGGGQPSGVNADPQVDHSPDQLRSALDLDLSSEALDNGIYRILLHGRHAKDLYQIGATLEFDPALYEIVLVEAGGGLGGPHESYFIDGLTKPGKLDFAYTRRWFGDGISGDPLLLSVKVRPLGKFNKQDFRIDTSAAAIRVRDSKKQEMPFTYKGKVVGNE
jgi:hypothetical protein